MEWIWKVVGLWCQHNWHPPHKALHVKSWTLLMTETLSYWISGSCKKKKKNEKSPNAIWWIVFLAWKYLCWKAFRIYLIIVLNIANMNLCVCVWGRNSSYSKGASSRIQDYTFKSHLFNFVVGRFAFFLQYSPYSSHFLSQSSLWCAVFVLFIFHQKMIRRTQT